MPKAHTVAALQPEPPRLRRVRRVEATDHRAFTAMKRRAIRSLTLVAALAAVTGCQSAPRFAWWKRDKAPADASVVARSATPTLPSAQSTPQSVAVAGLTPVAPPSSTNLAAAAGPTTAGATGTAVASTAAAPWAPPVSIPVTSPSTLAGAPTADYSAQNALADRLVSTPSTMSPATSANVGAVAATGPYDPNAYRPSTASASPISNGGISENADRYATSPAGSFPITSPITGPQPLASNPADRYGSPSASIAPPTMPGTTPLTDPASVAVDRYSNPTLPTLPNKTAQATMQSSSGAGATASTTTAGASTVRLATAPGQYRPGRTSTYTGSSTSPVEVANRPSPPAATIAPAPPAAGGVSQPWAPSTPAAPTTGTRTY